MGGSLSPTARGIVFIVLGMLLFTLIDTLVKVLSAAGYATWQLVFCRSLFSFIPILILMRFQGGARLMRTTRLKDHLVRAAVGLGALWTWFYSYRNLPLADAYALGFTAPLFMTALSVPLLGERVGIHRWSAVAVGFGGVLVMVQPGSGVFDIAAVWVLVSAFLYALAMIQVRGLGKTEPPLTTVFYFTSVCTLVSALSLPFVGRLPDTAFHAALMVATGLLGGLAQLCLTHAYRLAPVSIIAPFDYTAMVWAVGLGLVVFGDQPGWPVLAGSAVVIASGLYILRREALRRSPAGGAPKPAHPGQEAA
jgi:drug/metabolite transporter (DMT)-like permease